MEIASRINRESLTDVKAFAYYRRNAKYRNLKNTNHRIKYRKIIVAFYKKISERLLYGKGGVFLPGFGYFVILLNPIKEVFDSIYRGEEGILINAHTGSRMYHPTFISTTNDLSMKSFTMDKQFTRDFKKKLGNSIKNGMKYTNHYGLLLSIFKSKKR